MELTELVERVAEIRTKGPTRFARERIQEAAESISRAGSMQLRVELANEALAALCVVCMPLMLTKGRRILIG